MRFARLLFISITALAATACTDECPDGMVFGEDGTCRPDLACDENGRCPTGFVCMPAENPDHAPACVPQDAGAPSDGSVDAGGCSACEAPTPFCRTDDQTCVACLGDTDCAGARCDLESGQCVSCLSDTDCTDPLNPRCDPTTHTCAPCSDNLHCEGHPEGNVCDDSKCVLCKPGDAAACGGSPCTIDNVCSDFGASQGACEPCDTDDNCAADHFCVPMNYQGTARPTGYCLKSTAGGCDQPFGGVTISGRDSLSGRTGLSFCGIREDLTTCEAVLALQENVRCDDGTDGECPEGGVCRTVGAFNNRCTYRCTAPNQCIDSDVNPPASTCGAGPTGTASDYCGG